MDLAIKETLKQAGVSGDQIDEVIFRHRRSRRTRPNSGRQASVKGGIPHAVPVVTINKVCGSALKAVTMAASLIKAGDADIVMAGGMESMTNIPTSVPTYAGDRA